MWTLVGVPECGSQNSLFLLFYSKYKYKGAIHAEKWKEYLVGKVSWHSDQLRPNGVCCKDGDEYIINSVCCNHDDQYSIYINKMTQWLALVFVYLTLMNWWQNLELYYLHVEEHWGGHADSHKPHWDNEIPVKNIGWQNMKLGVRKSGEVGAFRQIRCWLWASVKMRGCLGR